VARVEATPEEISSADAVVLLTDHDAFDFEEIGRHARFIFDCRRRLAGPNVEIL
jgi:UDP-N-acetyl-D-glucosamine dehydrogenase